MFKDPREFLNGLLGFIPLCDGLAWGCICVPLYKSRVTATTSASLEALTGRESLSREEAFKAIRGPGGRVGALWLVVCRTGLSHFLRGIDPESKGWVSLARGRGHWVR